MEINNNKFSTVQNFKNENIINTNKDKINSLSTNNINNNLKAISKDNDNSTNLNSKKESVSKETLDRLVKEVNDKFKIINKEFSYDIHEETKRVTVKIKNSETGEVIKEIPSEESLDLAAKIMEMAGLLIDEKS